MKLKSIRQRVHAIVQPAQDGDVLSHTFDLGIMVLIVLNIAGIILESVAELRNGYGIWFWGFEVFSIVVFSVEYILRIWSCVEYPRYSRPLTGRLRYAASFMPAIDLLAVLPFYLPFVGLDLRFIRVVRLMRLFRVLKIGRYSKAMRTLGYVIRAKRGELGMTLFVLCLLLILASTMMYYAETGAQPEAFPHIPAAMWWAVATLTTVGYGDVFPVTVIGKVMGAVIAILGIGMFALPTGILGAGFVEEIQGRSRAENETVVCPHCGSKIRAPE